MMSSCFLFVCLFGGGVFEFLLIFGQCFLTNRNKAKSTVFGLKCGKRNSKFLNTLRCTVIDCIHFVGLKILPIQIIPQERVFPVTEFISFSTCALSVYTCELSFFVCFSICRTSLGVELLRYLILLVFHYSLTFRELSSYIVVL